jgi:hypothetical protein
MKYSKVNNYLGWAVFLIATIVYMLTLEETTSLWDCGEYITTSVGLEVGHPPGAPFFMMLGRLFSAFSSPENAAYMVNAMSALSSSGTILFMFWTLTMLGRKLSLTTRGTIDTASTIAIFGSAAVGALAYMFTDSFWFSAVEGEVYAMSSFFTALVVWAIFKWEVETDEHDADILEKGETTARPNRWLIFIAYMIGLSIGVHLLNLLAIPAIAFVIYFKKYKEIDLKSFVLTGIIGVGVLGFVQAFLIPQIPSFADVFERFFTNTLGMPFNTGFVIFVLTLAAGLTYGMYSTSRKAPKNNIDILVFGLFVTFMSFAILPAAFAVITIAVAILLYFKFSFGPKIIWNNIIVGFTMLIIGYSTFAMIVIRSNANTPLDENNPETLSALVAYLNREQYGTWPLLHGQYWNTDPRIGCEPEDMDPSNSSYTKVYASVLNYTQVDASGSDVNRIKEIVKPLEIKLEVKRSKKNTSQYTLSTQQYKNFVYFEGGYIEPTSTAVTELGDKAKFELTFPNQFEIDAYRSKVAEVNKQLAEENLGFQVSLNTEVSKKYIDLKAGDPGSRKYEAEQMTFLPRMYRQGSGKQYMRWVGYENNRHTLSVRPTGRNYGQRQAFPNREAEVNWLKAQNSEQFATIAQSLESEGIYIPNFFGENLSYAVNYQFGWMYMRYFFWNFSGRQNDTQGHSVNGGGREYLDGNWLTGVDFIDQERLGSQENLPAFIEQNKGYNRYYMLPLILALIGFIYHLMRAPKDWFIIMLVFLLTGFAIVFYLNQKPMEPRERDYAFAASFYAFAFWIGIGVYALFDAARNFQWKNIGLIAAYSFGAGVLIYLAESINGADEYGNVYHAFSYVIFYMSTIAMMAYVLVGFIGHQTKSGVLTAGLAIAIGLVVPSVLGLENWDDHDRSNRTTARDFAYNYLVSLDEKSENGKGAIIFTNGDNDTFPLWYLQEVERVRTDVRVANMSLLGTDWHINQMRRKAYDSEPLNISMNEFSFRNGTRDFLIIDERDELIYKSVNKWSELNTSADSTFNSLQTGKAFGYIGKAYSDLMLIDKKVQIALRSNSGIASKDLDARALNGINFVQLDSVEQANITKIDSDFKLSLGQINVAKQKLLSVVEGTPDAMMIQEQVKQAELLFQNQFAGFMKEAVFPIMTNIRDNIALWPKISYSVEEAVSFILDDNNKLGKDNMYGTCQEESFLGFSDLYMKVDLEAAVANKIITQEQADNSQDTITWSLKGRQVLKSDLAVLDLLRNYEWDRPIYFASRQQGLQANANLEKYFVSEGLAYKLTPVLSTGGANVNIDKMLGLVLGTDPDNSFLWGNMKGDGVLIDYYTLRMANQLRSQMIGFVQELISVGRNDDAIKVLDKVFEEMPIENNQVEANYLCYYFCELYYRAGATEKGNELATKLSKVALDEISHYSNQSGKFYISMLPELKSSLENLEKLRTIVDRSLQENSSKLNESFKELEVGQKADYDLLNADMQAGKFLKMDGNKPLVDASGKYVVDQAKIDLARKVVDAKYGLLQKNARSDYHKSFGDESASYYLNAGLADETHYQAVLKKAKQTYLDHYTGLKTRYSQEQIDNLLPDNYTYLWFPKQL